MRMKTVTVTFEVPVDDETTAKEVGQGVVCAFNTFLLREGSAALAEGRGTDDRRVLAVASLIDPVDVEGKYLTHDGVEVDWSPKERATYVQERTRELAGDVLEKILRR